MSHFASNQMFGKGSFVRRSGPATGHVLWLRADSVASVGDGNSVSTWSDRLSRYTFDATGTEGTFRASSSGANNKPTVEGGASTIFTSTETIDFTDTSQIHVFVIAQSGSNATNKFFIEQSTTSGDGTGFGMWSLSTEEPRVQHSGNVGVSAHVRTGVNTSTAYHLIEGRFNKILNTTEAQLFFDGTLGNSRPGDADNTDMGMDDDFIYLFARAGGTFPLMGNIAEILIYDEVKDGKCLTQTYDYLSIRYDLTIA